MKRVISTILLSILMLLLVVGCSNTSSTNRQETSKVTLKEEKVASAGENTAAPKGGTMQAQAFRPAPVNMTGKNDNDYPIMGVKFNLPDKLKDMVNSNNIFMMSDGKLSFENVMDYSYLSFSFISKGQQDKTPGSGYRGAINEYGQFLEWMKGTYRVAEIGVYSKEQLVGKSIEKITELPINEKIGEQGNHEFYFSMNKSPEKDQKEFSEMYEKTKDLFAEVKKSMKISKPAPIDRTKFGGFATERRNDAKNIGDFKAQDLNGKEITKDIFAGYKITLVNIYTTWCSPCIEEIPYLNEIAKELKSKGVNVIGIVDDVIDPKTGKINEVKRELAKKIVQKTGVEYSMLIPDDVLSNGILKGIPGFPETHFVDKDGNFIGESYMGGHTKDEWTKIIDDVLKKLGDENK